MTAEEEVIILKKTIEELTAKFELTIEELKAEISRLKAGSNKSNKPPSSDGYGKPAVKNSRVKSGKKSGGQPLHEGKTLLKTETPDYVVDLNKVTSTCECGGDVVLVNDEYIVRQVADIEIPKKKVTEYRQYKGICNICKRVYKQEFPKYASNTVVYGNNIKSVLIYLNHYQLVPLKRTTEIMKELFGLNISQASVLSAAKEVNEKLTEENGFIDELKKHLLKDDVCGFDESGFRSEGSLKWLHTASTSLLTYYFMHKKRGKEAIDDMEILPNYTGVAVHDHWKPYYKYKNCVHAECNAHILRYLMRLKEDLEYEWAGEMKNLLLQIKETVDKSKNDGIDKLELDAIKEFEEKYRKILEEATKENERRIALEPKITPKKDEKVKKRKKNDSERLAQRMSEYSIETLSFMYDFKIPFDNNQAERDIRMPKAKQKISGTFRTENGGKTFASIRSAISTLIKNGKPVLEGLNCAIFGNLNSFLSW